jgi:nitroreductase
MSNTQFEQISTVIKSRRSTGWAKMNGQTIPNETINQLLELAHWAPTHGRTEPWRFFVYGGEAKTKFGKDHAQLYWDNTAEDKRQEATMQKLEHNVDKASHLIIAVMERGANDKIPQIEEIAAASAAVQNMLLGATALGIASFWTTGGMTHKEALKQHLGLKNEDIVLGLIFLGYTDEPAKDGVRNSMPETRISWM